MKNSLKLTVAAVALLAGFGQAQALTFDEALGINYDNYSNYEIDNEVNMPDSMYFESKSMSAAQARPEDLSKWNLLGFHAHELSLARGRLDRALNSRNMSQFPKISARAQAKYDCWVERAEEKWDDVAIAECRRAFYDALAVLEGGAPTMFSKADLNIFFGFDSAALSATERAKLQRVADEFRRSGYNDIYMEGHTDTSGDVSYNLNLSARRAESVKQALISYGVPASDVRIVAEGEGKLLVETGDGVKEARNRRVWLTFK